MSCWKAHNQLSNEERKTPKENIAPSRIHYEFAQNTEEDNGYLSSGNTHFKFPAQTKSILPTSFDKCLNNEKAEIMYTTIYGIPISPDDRFGLDYDMISRQDSISTLLYGNATLTTAYCFEHKQQFVKWTQKHSIGYI